MQKPYATGVDTLFSFLQEGTWTRPTDKMAVYTEVLPNCRWGIRVTLFADTARVEAIEGPKCTWYKPPRELSIDVHPPNLWERLRGITFETKLAAAVEEKRAYARAKNEQL
ncbi:MAG: hypothetical protein GX030_06345 [Firmicutes bacterium]|nr:hypothetical protein [Bacillota bacterium]